MTDVRLGAHWDGAGTTVAVHAAAGALELCLPGAEGETRLAMAQAGGGWQLRVPGLGPGDRYGLRAHGPGHDPSRLLTDPYARRLDGGLRWNRAALAPGTDTAGRVPWSVVVDPGYDWGADAPRPHHDLADSVLYELHVRGFTQLMPELPPALRGTYAGLAHPAAIDRLTRLGITAVELLPLHHFVDEPHLQALGLRNYWGYNSLGWFAPHAGYAAGDDPVREFKNLVRALHAAGLEVLLDVVYNHTAEGEADGPTLCWRGLDDAIYYRHHDGSYENVTGCGNTVDTRQPVTREMVLDSLRYWVREMHVDGFRFDLAPALARTDHGFDPAAEFLTAIAQDPLLAKAKLIAEPWDVGPGGYRLGQFPAPWAEWNDRFSGTVRDLWRGAQVDTGELARRLSGSPDLFGPAHLSVNLVTAHDGFTLADLTAYDRKHNETNGEQNRDGTDDNRSWNGGAEGPTDDPAVLANRRSRRRAMLATALLSAGVSMLTAGDELGRSQDGNNNAYCQDGPISWLDWSQLPDDPALPAMVAGLVALREAHPALRSWVAVDWYAPDGWPPPAAVDGALAARVVDGDGQALEVWLNPRPDPASVCTAGEVLLDTAADDPLAPRRAAASVELGPWSVLVLRRS